MSEQQLDQSEKILHGAKVDVILDGKKIGENIMFDSDEAATHRKGLEGWVDRHGHYHGTGEHAARYAGCTHRACEDCSEPTEKMYTHCEKCRHRRDIERYDAMEFKEWNGTTPLYSLAMDKYLFDLDLFKDDLENEDNPTDLADLRFVICDPRKLGAIDEDHWMDDLPEEGELPDEVAKALQEFNEVLEDAGTVSWSPGKYRTDIPNKSEPMTEEEFEALTPAQKGYAVYMSGARDDEPNIPESYDPSPEDQEEYEGGQRMAVQHAQDDP